ncbi:MAG TPA: hypothetical protein VJH03_01580 [Blastocatellia bacterium]|nr:hypothetical protein [Blastocatellia bacterium]
MGRLTAKGKRPEAALKSRAAFSPFILLIATLPLLASAFRGAAQSSANDLRPTEASFAYRFENPRFYISIIDVEVGGDGRATVRFKRGESGEMLEVKHKLLPGTLARIRRLYDMLNFLGSQENYQDKKDFSHLGWKTISERAGERERKARFNYTTNEAAKELSDIFHGVATQEIRLFDMDLAEQHQPLEMPAQLAALEDELRLERITEPERLLQPLREMAMSETLPLIARNHATRLITAIEKKKYKSPIGK